MTETVHQGQITREAAAAEGLSQKLLRETARQILLLVKEALLRDGQVRIHNFGTFRVRWVKAHRGTNPQTGERIAVPAHPRALFTPAKALRETVEAGALSGAPATESAEPRPPILPAAAAARLRAPTIVKRTRADVPSEAEGGPQPPEPAGEPDAEPRSDRDRRPLLAVAVVAVLALLALILLWPGAEDEPRVAQAPEPPVAERTDVAASPPPAQAAPREEDLSIGYDRDGEAIEQVVAAPGDRPTRPSASPAAEHGQTGSRASSAISPRPAASESTGWQIEALDRPVRRAGPAVIDRTGSPRPAEVRAPDEPTGAAATVTEATPAPDRPSPSTASGPYFEARDYRIVSGDNLWDLSGEHYVRPYYWPHIYNANQERIRDPNLIRAESEIRLPTLYGHPEDLTGRDRRSIAEGYFLLYRLFKRSSDPDAVFALSAVSHFDKSVIAEHESEIQASHDLEVELAEVYGMRIADRIFLAGRNVQFPSRLFD